MFRQMIRVTWGNEAYLEHINASLLFVVGRYPSLKIQFALEQESRKSVYTLRHFPSSILATFPMPLFAPNSKHKIQRTSVIT
jgi:hypothetical protein